MGASFLVGRQILNCFAALKVAFMGNCRAQTFRLAYQSWKVSQRPFPMSWNMSEACVLRAELLIRAKRGQQTCKVVTSWLYAMTATKSCSQSLVLRCDLDLTEVWRSSRVTFLKRHPQMSQENRDHSRGCVPSSRPLQAVCACRKRLRPALTRPRHLSSTRQHDGRRCNPATRRV